MPPASHLDLRLCGLEAEEFAVVSPPLFSIPFWQLLFLGQIAPCLPACLRHGNREKGKNGQDYISIHVSKFDLHGISCNIKWLHLGKVGKGGGKPRVRFLRWNREFHWGESTLLWSNLPITPWVIFLPIQFSRSVVSHSLPPHGLQHARPPCPSPTFGVYSNSCPLSWWCHPTISSSVIPFSSCPQSFPTSRGNEAALCMRWSKYWSFSFSISSSNEQPGLISCRMDWLCLLAVQGTLKSLLQHHSSKASILWCSPFFIV